MLVQSKNPATGKLNKDFETFTKYKVLEICKSSRKAFDEWKKQSFDERAYYLRKLAKVLRQKKQDYGKIITMEMGKPINQAMNEVEKCAWAAEIYADNAEDWLKDEVVKTEAKKSVVTFDPLGVILSIMPWNFPFWQALRFGIPALSAGNVSVLRHSNVVPMCAMAIEEAFNLAGFPQNVFRTVITDHDKVDYLIKTNGLIDGVSLTGSVEAGKKVAQTASKNIKKFVLELGGSDPFIVLEDADLNLACKGAVDGRTVNSGQSCIAAKRFIVVKDVAEQFTKKVVDLMSRLKVGDPMDEKTDVGPLANEEQLEKMEMQIKDAVDKGAKLEVGGKRISGKGWFFEPTVLTNVKDNMKVLKEEVFGPVMPIIVVRNEKEAVRLANDSEFGLGASIWTKDLDKGFRLAKQIESGMVFVNNIVKSDPRLPFGGIKSSGIGRELSHYGLKEFVNVKTINIY